jgi:hypothetical protein
MINDYQRLRYAAEKETAIARRAARRLPADSGRDTGLWRHAQTLRGSLLRLLYALAHRSPNRLASSVRNAIAEPANNGSAGA